MASCVSVWLPRLVFSAKGERINPGNLRRLVRVSMQVGVGSPETKVDGGYLAIFEN